MFSFISEFTAAKKLTSLRFHVIFFAESRSYFQYFRHLYEAILAEPYIRVAYISSDKNDPVLSDSRIMGFYSKATLAGVFPRLQADVVIMTMPDLQNFIFKKSPAVKKYVYVFHALVSTHQQYRQHAFDHYDAIFCAGPRQELEIRESESLYSLPAKNLVRCGYPILAEFKERVNKVPLQTNKVLIAPSWYAEGIFNACIVPLIQQLSGSRYEVWIRPHPEFVKRNKGVYKEIVKVTNRAKNIHFDNEPAVYTHLAGAANLLTDRSGIALEYAFATGRPVLFVETPPKVLNPDVNKYSLEPLENKHRAGLGTSLQPHKMDRVIDTLNRLETNTDSFKETIANAETEVVFPQNNLQNGVDYIRGQLS
jgi:YidC/Oxa1 family membrane protein insertase